MNGTNQQYTWMVPIGLLFIVTASVVVYVPAMRGDFIWDDDCYVQKNPLLRSDNGPRQIWFSLRQPSQYFPMVYTSFRFEYALWGLNPTGYHITNIVLHIINALLLWWVLRSLSLPGAWLAAVIFALHPVHVESVAWITERKNVLMVFFFFLSLLVWVRFAGRSHRSQRAWPMYVLSLLLYALALFSKATACTLPAALVLLLWLKSIRVDIKRWLQITPYVLLGSAVGLFTVWYERYRVGTGMLELGINPIERVLIAGRALWFYIGKLVWPVNLAFSYPSWEIDSSDLSQYGWLFACLVVVLAMWKWRDNLGRGPLAAIVFFVATLFPMLGFFSLYTFRYTYVADHYQYVASVGPIALLTAIGYQIANRIGKWGKRVAVVIAAFALVTLGTLTWQQCHIYKDLETLWRDTLKKNPDSWLANNNLAVLLIEQGALEEAIKHCRQALRINPDYVEGHNNLGNALAKDGKLDEAIEHFHQALKIKPDHIGAHNNLGRALAKKGKLDEAVGHYRQALRLNPNRPVVLYNLGEALRLQAKYDEAITCYKESLRLKPDQPGAHRNLAMILFRQGKLDEAIIHYEYSIQFKEDQPFVLNKLGENYFLRGEIKEAFRCWNKVLELEPEWVGAINNLAWIKATHPDTDIRNPDEAVQLALRACKLTEYNRADILDTLAVAYAAAGRFAEAIQAAEKAISAAEATNQPQLTEHIQHHLELFERGRPYYDSAQPGKKQGP